MAQRMTGWESAGRSRPSLVSSNCGIGSSCAPTLLERYDYAPFGEEITQGIDGRGVPYSSNSYPTATMDGATEKFTSKERDSETGLDYFGARYMSSAQGRFTSPDSYEIVTRKNQGRTRQEQQALLNSFISNPQAWNKYGYGLNNPLKNIDIGGHCSAPAGLRSGQTGVCIEAFIASNRVGVLGIGVGDGRKIDPNGGTYRIRGDVRIDPGSGGLIYSNTDVAKSSVFVEGLGIKGSGGVGLSSLTATDEDGTRHFSVSGEGINGFSGMGGPGGDIRFEIQFSVSPSGEVSVDSVTGRTFPSLEIFSYEPGQAPKLLFAFAEHKEEDLKKPEKRLDQPDQQQ